MLPVAEHKEDNIKDHELFVTCEFSKELLADQPEQGADVQFQLLLGQMDPKLIQGPWEAGVYITYHLLNIPDTRLVVVNVPMWWYRRGWGRPKDNLKSNL
jgi:hypothetical protein